MTPKEFVYWLQGYLEVSQSKTIDATGTDQIRKHLALVLTNVTDDKTETKKPKPERISLPDTWKIPNLIKLCSSGHSDTPARTYC